MEMAPNNAEAIKTNNVIEEKITLFTNTSTSKHGIGLGQTAGVQSRMHFYVPTP
jgi:hypothetical protein